MTKPIRIHVNRTRQDAQVNWCLMCTAIYQLHADAALRGGGAIMRGHRATITVHPARGAKPFVLRVLREFAALCEE